jgi:uncharacterized protein YdhG (YjbR/CyaY superfamily)
MPHFSNYTAIPPDAQEINSFAFMVKILYNHGVTKNNDGGYIMHIQTDTKQQTTPAVPDPIGDYIKELREDVQPLMRQVRGAIRKALPDAKEKISWQMPTFWQKRNLIHFAAQKNHLGIYPGAEAMEYFAPQFTEYKTSKGAVQFPYKAFGDEQLALIAEIAEWCGKQAEN